MNGISLSNEEKPLEYQHFLGAMVYWSKWLSEDPGSIPALAKCVFPSSSIRLYCHKGKIGSLAIAGLNKLSLGKKNGNRRMKKFGTLKSETIFWV